MPQFDVHKNLVSPQHPKHNLAEHQDLSELLDLHHHTRKNLFPENKKTEKYFQHDKVVDDESSNVNDSPRLKFNTLNFDEPDEFDLDENGLASKNRNGRKGRSATMNMRKESSQTEAGILGKKNPPLLRVAQTVESE